MKILSAEQIRELDKHTIASEPIASIVLMERAASVFVEAISDYVRKNDHIVVICGMGNNGGDGLAVARMLIEQGFLHVTTYVVKISVKGSSDFIKNEKRMEQFSGILYVETVQQLPHIPANSIVIDALFGSGLSRPVEGVAADVIKTINDSGAVVYSIDVPSGLYCDKPNKETDTVVEATMVFTFHAPKLSFMYPASQKFVQEFEVLDIGLDEGYAESLPSPYYYLTADIVQKIFKRRSKFSHKGSYGHALLCAGSYGKIGAAVLSVKGALHSGAGLVSTLTPPCGYSIMQIANPEAMVLDINRREGDVLMADDLSKSELDVFDAVGVGPGLSVEDDTVKFLEALLKRYSRPLVIDADALNILAHSNHLLKQLAVGSILTPHPGEFKRLVGEWKDDREKLQLQMDFSKAHNVVVVLKGAHTSIAIPDGKIYFNATGNPGMAKGGSGDVLTGVITSILAQGYTSEQAAIIGVFVHGMAGDYAAVDLSETGMSAGDLLKYLPKAFSVFE